MFFQIEVVGLLLQVNNVTGDAKNLIKAFQKVQQNLAAAERKELFYI